MASARLSQGVCTALTRAGVLVLIACLWEFVTRFNLVDTRLLPSFSSTVSTLYTLVKEPGIQSHILLSVTETMLALLVSLPLGIGLGLLIAENRYWDEVLRPLLYFPLSIPKSVFLPLFVLMMGITLTQKVAFGVFSTVFIVIMSTATAVESVSADHVTVAKSYGATRTQIVTRVYIPSMLPLLLEGVRLAMIFDFTGILIAEMYGARSGLGFLITSWGDTFALRELIAGILLVSAISILFNEAVRAVERRLGSWRTL